MNPRLAHAVSIVKPGTRLCAVPRRALWLLACALAVAVPMSRADAGAHLAALESAAVPIALLVAVFIVAASLALVHRRARRPLERLIAAAESVARGDVKFSIEDPGRGDLGRLAAALRRMAEEIERARRESSGRSQDLEQRVANKTEELSRAQREMVHMERFASLGKLAAAVAHELNNPLSAMLMYARLVERELPEGGFPSEKREELARFLTQIQKDASRCGNVVRNLLLFARAPGADFTLHRVSQIIERSVKLVRHHLEMARIDLEVDMLAQDVAIACDADQLQQAIVNLLVNTAEKTPAGGQLSLSVTSSEGAVRIDLSGSGTGVTAERPGHIGEAFFVEHDEGSTIGLGLPVVLGIVQRHGGRMEVGSGTGTAPAFRIILPHAAPEAAPS